MEYDYHQKPMLRNTRIQQEDMHNARISLHDKQSIYSSLLLLLLQSVATNFISSPRNFSRFVL